MNPTADMTDPLYILLFSAVTLGAFHTAVGIDHTLPFVVLGRSRQWTLSKTLLVTLTCGLGHVLSSVFISAIGLGLGVAGSRLLAMEETRGAWAAWCLVGFGLAYAGVGIWKRSSRAGRELGPQEHHFMPGLFLVFVLGPCEALLPLLTASGISLAFQDALLVTLAFSGATIGTMLGLVALGYVGASFALVRERFATFERHAHVVAGLTLAASGLCVQLLGI